MKEQYTENEFNAIKNFILDRLNNFKTEKESNRILLNLFEGYINNIKEKNKAGVTKIINELEHLESIIQESERLKTWLYTMRKQIEHLDFYAEAGMSEILPIKEMPQKNVYDKLYDVLSAEHEFSLEKLLKLVNDKEWIKNMSIICVYGNMKSYGNVYGHTLLRLGEVGYLHINGLMSAPEFIPHYKFNKYLKDENSFVVDYLPLPSNLDERKVIQEVQKYSDDRWLWKITHHNCLSFAREVARQCGVSEEHLGMGHGHIKTPINFFMALDKEKKGTVQPINSNGWLTRHLVLNPLDNLGAVTNALLKQKLLKKNCRPENYEVTMKSNNQYLLFGQKSNRENAQLIQEEKNTPSLMSIRK